MDPFHQDHGCEIERGDIFPESGGEKVCAKGETMHRQKRKENVRHETLVQGKTLKRVISLDRASKPNAIQRVIHVSSQPLPKQVCPDKDSSY
jgi:hypothetical protein